MVIQPSDEKVSLSVQFTIKADWIKIVKQKKISHIDDEVYVGIYLYDEFSHYIVACTRKSVDGWSTLDYTKFSANLENAYKQLEEMEKEVIEDIGR